MLSLTTAIEAFEGFASLAEEGVSLFAQLNPTDAQKVSTSLSKVEGAVTKLRPVVDAVVSTGATVAAAVDAKDTAKINSTASTVLSGAAVLEQGFDLIRQAFAGKVAA